jgi:hypothetical protein
VTIEIKLLCIAVNSCPDKELTDIVHKKLIKINFKHLISIPLG